MKKFSIIIICIFCLASCRNTINEFAVDRTIECKESQIEPDIPKFVKDVTFLPLETNANTLLGSVDKVEFYDGTVYIADYSTRKVVAYDMTGKLRFVLDRQGRGPGEYLENTLRSKAFPWTLITFTFWTILEESCLSTIH